MANPYKVYDRNQGPGWLKQLDKYVDLNLSNAEARIKDTKASHRNHGGDASAKDEATYIPQAKRQRFDKSMIGQKGK